MTFVIILHALVFAAILAPWLHDLAEAISHEWRHGA